MKHKETLLQVAVFVSVITLTSCAALAPQSYSVYAEHTSHVLQHFGSHSTDYGYNAVFGAATWRHRNRGGPFLTIAEGYNFTHCWHAENVQGCGALEGGREVFEARAGWTFRFSH